MNKQVIEKRNNINIILTKKVLKEKFWRFKKKSQNFIDTITISLLGGIIFMLIYNTPIIVNNSMGNIIQFENGVLSMLAPLGTSTLICGFYFIKRMRDYNKVFKTFNNELGKDALSESEIDDESECLDIELKKFINDTCILKIQQEVEKQKLENITKYRISETKVSDFMKKIMTKKNIIKQYL